MKSIRKDCLTPPIFSIATSCLGLSLLGLMKLSQLVYCTTLPLQLPNYSFLNFFWPNSWVFSPLFLPHYCARGRAIIMQSRFDNLWWFSWLNHLFMNLPSSWVFKDTFCEPNIVLVSRKMIRNVLFYLVSAHVYLTGHRSAWRWGVWICNKPSLVYAVLIVKGYLHVSRGIGSIRNRCLWCHWYDICKTSI